MCGVVARYLGACTVLDLASFRGVLGAHLLANEAGSLYDPGEAQQFFEEDAQEGTLAQPLLSSEGPPRLLLLT